MKPWYFYLFTIIAWAGVAVLCGAAVHPRLELAMWSRVALFFLGITWAIVAEHVANLPSRK